MDSGSGQYYLHNFLPEQPDLDWWSEDVRAAFDDILRFWFERDVAASASTSRTCS
jgi:alpha-glucosidase